MASVTSIVAQQHLAERSAAAAAHPFTAAGLLRGRRFTTRCGNIVAFKTFALEVEIEAFVEQCLLVRRFRQHQGQRVLQHRPIAVADHTHGAGGIDSLGGRYAQAGATRGLQELPQRLRGLHALRYQPGILPRLCRQAAKLPAGDLDIRLELQQHVQRVVHHVDLQRRCVQQ